MSDAATTTVTFTVIDVEPVQGPGRLVALAKVELELDGVVLVMQGFRVLRQRDRITTQAPSYRDPRTGRWLPALIVPDELEQAIARELHRTWLCERDGSFGEALPRAGESSTARSFAGRVDERSNAPGPRTRAR